MKLNASDTAARIELARTKTPVGSVWLHYKGGVYVVTGHSLHTETLETLVDYRRVGGPDFNAIDEALVVWSRPIGSWIGRTDDNIDRFVRLT